MSNVIIISLAYLAGISLLLLLNEVNYHWFRIKGEYTRKMAHVAATLATLPFPYLFSSHWYVLALALLFFGVLWLTQKSQHLNSIHDIRRRSYGSYILPVAIYVTFLIYTKTGNPIMYILPITILAICDPVAALAGMSVKKYNRKLTLPGQNSQKTLVGSLAFFVSSAVLSAIVLFWNQLYEPFIIYRMVIAVAIWSTLAELFSWRGSDNMTIPLSVQFVLIWLV